MKIERSYPKCIISSKGADWVKAGHPWIYEGEVVRREGDCLNGGLVDAFSGKGTYLGTGFLSAQSKIRVRLLSRNANDSFDAAFWKRRIQYAWNYRKAVMDGQTDCCRLIFGEADGFPGLTVDRFHDILVTQTLSVGIETRKNIIFPLLVEVLREDGQEIRGLFERNDAAIRELEGLAQGKGWYPLPGLETPESPVTEICENGIFYRVDVENGQKTGFFLDQKYNRQAVARLARGRRVLDCFTHTGSFALNVARGGAEYVEGWDISAAAVEMAKENARRNSLEHIADFQQHDVFDRLTELSERAHKPFDFIILDPPAFTKSRKTADRAERGYREINYLAMKLLPRGGYLATASCSHFMPNERFVQMLRTAARDANVQLRQIEVRQQGPDHPILWNVPETDYLKFYLFQVV